MVRWEPCSFSGGSVTSVTVQGYFWQILSMSRNLFHLCSFSAEIRQKYPFTAVFSGTNNRRTLWLIDWIGLGADAVKSQGPKLCFPPLQCFSVIVLYPLTYWPTKRPSRRFSGLNVKSKLYLVSIVKPQYHISTVSASQNSSEVQLWNGAAFPSTCHGAHLARGHWHSAVF